jgi:deazaflavin-dependent oxidoreductase (nitroreductase family)
MLFRRTGRSLGGRVAQAPTLLLTTIGRKSGAERTTPLVYVRDGHDFLVLAAYGGSPWNPHWLVNLRHAPTAIIDMDGSQFEVSASEVTGNERDDLLPLMRQSIKSLATAEARTDRKIPLVRLAPTSADP